MLIGQNEALALYAVLHHYLRLAERKAVLRIKVHCLIPALLPLTVSLFILQTQTLPQQAPCQMLLVHWAWEFGSRFTHSKIEVQFSGHFSEMHNNRHCNGHSRAQMWAIWLTDKDTSSCWHYKFVPSILVDIYMSPMISWHRFIF